MTTTELAEKLTALATVKMVDIEVRHCDADNLLLAFIDDPEVTEAYNSFEKWYA